VKNKVTPELTDKIKFLYSQGLTQKAIGEEVGLAQTTIGLVLNPDKRGN